MRGDGISKKQLACSESDARATMRPAAAVEAHRQRECDPPNRSRRPIQSQGNRFERQPPAPPQTYDASFVRAGGAPVAFAMSDEPERKPERKGRQIDAFLEELKTRQAGEPQLPIKGSYPDGDRSTTNLYVGNISPATTEAQLAKIFARYGQLESVKIMWPRTDEERRRGRNCGFVQYSKRQDACAAKDSLDGEYVDGKRIKVGWGKAVPEARVPQQPAGPSLSDLAAEAQARAKQVLMKATGMTPMKDCDARISVVIPADPEQKDIADRLAEIVVEDPGVEDVIREREKENPLFSFLRRKSLVQTYYRCRVWTLLMGARSPQPFRMADPGPFWVPPGSERSRSPSPEPLEEREEEFMTGRQAERAREANRARGKHRKLTVEEREMLVLSVEGLTCSRALIAEALLRCYDAATSAPDVCLILKRSICRCAMTTSLASRAARLFLISDVLRNASSSRTGATFRTTIQRWLPEALEHLAKARNATTHRIAKERFERRVEATLQAWLRWSLFPPAFVHGLESAFFFDENDDDDVHAHQGERPDVLALKRRARQAGVFDGDDWRRIARRVNRARRFSRARLSGASCEEAVALAAEAARRERPVQPKPPVVQAAEEDSSDCDGEPCDAADLVDERDLVPPAMLPPTGFAVRTLPPAPAPAPAPKPRSPRAPIQRRPRSRSRSRERRRERERSPRRRRSRSRSRERRREPPPRGRRDDYYPRR